MDAGPIIAQRAVPILEGDDEESLSGRILEQEHELYREAINLVALGLVSVEGGRVRVAAR
jgi:phosphoribosylglycinamide formyltransferase-1